MTDITKYVDLSFLDKIPFLAGLQDYEKIAIVVNVGLVSAVVLGVVGSWLNTMLFPTDRFPVDGRVRYFAEKTCFYIKNETLIV